MFTYEVSGIKCNNKIYLKFKRPFQRNSFTLPTQTNDTPRETMHTPPGYKSTFRGYVL